MNTIWTSHLVKTPDKREELSNAIKGSAIVLKRLGEILTNEIDKSLKAQRDIDHYNTPNWELRQVDCNATQRALIKIKNLIEI